MVCHFPDILGHHGAWKISVSSMPILLLFVIASFHNGPMEGFWDILKRERHYGKHFTSKQELVLMIGHYIRYYNTRRVQRNLEVLTPMEKYELCLTT